MDNIKKYEQIAYDEAKLSKCKIRQVGAVLIFSKSGLVLGQGHNYSSLCPCNDNEIVTNCSEDIIHAETACLIDAEKSKITKNGISFIIFITQPPCNDCINDINQFEKDHQCFIDIHICEKFMKFDDDKVRYDLIPPEWETALAEVLTYGAKKYKPNNWRRGEVDRYIGAVMRHWNAYRKGEYIDPVTTMPHLWHMFTNIGFIITLENEIENKNNIPETTFIRSDEEVIEG